MHSAIYETLFGVVVFQRSILDWRRGWGQSPMEFYYVKLLWCSGDYIDLLPIRGGVGSICYGYMCILLYMKLIQCSGVA